MFSTKLTSRLEYQQMAAGEPHVLVSGPQLSRRPVQMIAHAISDDKETSTFSYIASDKSVLAYGTVSVGRACAIVAVWRWIRSSPRIQPNPNSPYDARGMEQ
jgi:hypothetical protein